MTYSMERQFGWFLPAGKTCGRGHSVIFGSPGYAPGILSYNARDACSNMYRYRFSEVWTARPNLLVSFRAGVTRDPHRDVKPLPVSANGACAAGLTGTLSCYTPIITIENLSQVGGFSNGIFGIHSQRTPFTVNLAWSKGKHQYLFGVDYVTAPLSSYRYPNPWGNFGFSHRETALPGMLAAQTGGGVASFFLGAADSGTVQSNLDSRLNTAEGALYAQDSWRASNKLTINYGLRWELTTPLHELQNKISSFDPSLPNPGAGNLLGALSFYGQGPGRNGRTRIGDYYFRAFAPKLGVAYSITPKTVFRASFGISYFPYWSKWVWSLGPTYPSDGFQVTRNVISQNSGITPAFYWDNGFPGVFPTSYPVIDPTLDNGFGINYLDAHDKRPPLVENLGAELERELPGHVLFRAAYVGTLAHRVYAGYNFDQLPLKHLSYGSLLNQNINSAAAKAAGIPVPYSGYNSTVARALTPYPQFTSVTDLEAQAGNTSYNSLQINVQRHFGSLTFLGNVTLAKHLTMSDSAGFGYNVNLKSQSFQIPQTARALSVMPGSAGDIAKQMNLSWYWDLPVGRGKHFFGNTSRALDYLVGNCHRGKPLVRPVRLEEV
jgi:hypothetical protein